MNVSKLRTELEHRLSLDVNDDYGIEESWKNLTSILSDNIVDTINFFSKECTDEELFWLSEVFSDISEIVQNKEFVQVLRSRLSQVTRESYDQNSFKSEHMKKWIDYDEYVRSVNLDIDYAEGALREE
ncbi:MAG: hypothetical protein IIY93_08680 [Clostridia bacterium]|jgi:hypothetical protein|nr:hypothetical protein [Clostridia bacterium]